MILKHKLDGITGERLSQLHDAPKQLVYKGVNPNELLSRPAVAIVGSRKMTPYGRAVTEQLARELARAGVTIISGLALGVDSAAHRACIEAGGLTMAVLPCSPDLIYPSSHAGLALQIVTSGGSLVSEYDQSIPSLKYTFVARNRIIATLADAVLITEAALHSGSLHTAGFALDLGKPVMAVPGPITGQSSEGTNQLIKTGAITVTGIQDVMDVLNLKASTVQNIEAGTDDERSILNALRSGVSDGLELLESSGLESPIFAQTLTMLEIHGSIRALGADKWGIA